jgi:hypothetical protein
LDDEPGQAIDEARFPSRATNVPMVTNSTTAASAAATATCQTSTRKPRFRGAIYLGTLPGTTDRIPGGSHA